jgi:hypothetical protein
MATFKCGSSRDLIHNRLCNAYVPAEQTIVASVMGVILVFSGLLFRSFGKDDDKYRKSK